MATRVLLVGHGRMGCLIESLSAAHDVEIVGYVDSGSAGNPESWPDAEVAIDFSTAHAVPDNVRHLAARGVSIVIGTTGWAEHEPELRRAIAARDIGVVAAPNFAPGVHVLGALAARAAELLAAQGGFGAWIHEAHHAAKRDAPSGTALLLESTMRDAGYGRAIDVSSTRAGSIPGTHTIGFDSAGETITLTHTARDRSAFAHGALDAARWVRGRHGWFTMGDVMAS